MDRSFHWTVLMVCMCAPGLARGQQWSFVRVADTNNVVPGSTTPFQFFNIPSIGDGAAGFAGFSSSGLTGPAGVYTGSGGALSVVIDRQTPSPSGGTFLGFAFGASVWPSINRGEVAFNAGDGVEGGIFFKSGSTISPVATTLTPIPNGAGVNFMVVDSPSLESGRVAFTGAVSPSGGAGGVYSWQSGVLSVVADHTTPMPGGPGTFERVFDCDLDQGTIVFSGEHKFGHQGIYRADTGGVLTRLYDSATVVPGGGGGTFTGLSQAVQSDGRIAFYGQGGGTEGVYTDVSGALEVLANRSTPIPGLPGQVFGGFSRISIDDGVIAFNAITNSGLSGIYSTHTGTLAKVLRFGDALDGRVVAGVSIGGQAMDGNAMAIWVRFTNGDYGVYMATIPAPGTLLIASLLLLPAARRSRHAPTI